MKMKTALGMRGTIRYFPYFMRLREERLTIVYYVQRYQKLKEHN